MLILEVVDDINVFFKLLDVLGCMITHIIIVFNALAL
jgi:hypothetical protein